MVGDTDAQSKVAPRVVDRHGEDVDNSQADCPVIMLALLRCQRSPCKRLTPGKGPVRQSCDGRNQIVSDIVVLLILKEPFGRPGIEEELPTSSFRNLSRLAKGCRYKAVGRYKITKSGTYLARGCAFLELFNKEH